MRVKFIGGAYLNGENPAHLILGKVYDVLSIENGWYRIIDEDPDDYDTECPGYLYPPSLFKIVDNTNVPGNLYLPETAKDWEANDGEG